MFCCCVWFKHKFHAWLITVPCFSTQTNDPRWEWASGEPAPRSTLGESVAVSHFANACFYEMTLTSAPPSSNHFDWSFPLSISCLGFFRFTSYIVNIILRSVMESFDCFYHSFCGVDLARNCDVRVRGRRRTLTALKRDQERGLTCGRDPADGELLCGQAGSQVSEKRSENLRTSIII